MDKIARKPSPDPAQEKIRQAKAVWNKEVSAFINDLINFKKMMNGYPSKFHMERSFIKDPIPADPGTILGVLASDFQDLAQKGNNIITQQLDYSKNRKKKQPKPAPGVAPVAVPEVPNLTQQLAASSDYNLIAEGSNQFTRLFSRLKGPWFGSSPEVRTRRYRLAMLRGAAMLEKEFEKFEATVLGSSAESIFIASKLLSQIESHLGFINDSLNVLNAPQLPQGAPAPVSPATAPSEPDVFKEQIEAANEVIGDFRRNYANFTDLEPALIKNFSSLILRFLSASPADKVNLVPEIIGVYHAILADANAKNGTSAQTLADVLLTKKASQLEIVAQNIINKWIGKAKHTLDPFDKTSAIRLDISKESEQVRKILDAMMNTLEGKDINMPEIARSLKEINDKMAKIKLLMKPLESTIKNKLFDDTFVNLLEKNKLTDYPTNLSDKEKQQLARMLQTKQFREMGNLYSKNK